MKILLRALTTVVFLSCGASRAAHADQQSIPLGHSAEGELAASSGPDGICNTIAAGDDVQITAPGSAAADRFEIQCGADGLVGTTAGGDDVQLRAPGSSCGAADVPVIDTGADGFANSTPGGDDLYFPGMALGFAPADTPCVGTGADAVSNSTIAGDDVQMIAVGMGDAAAAVVTCGDDLIPETVANNANPSGDDTQEIPVSSMPTCGSASDVVVRSGPTNSIADTQAEGPELVLKAKKLVKVLMNDQYAMTGKALVLQVENHEFGDSPASRDFTVEAEDGSCPDGTLRLVDADPTTDALDVRGTVDQKGSARVGLTAAFHPDDVRTVSTKIPYRCEATIRVVAMDTDPESDDARAKRNNQISLVFEVYDRSDI
jgi:hypothetical protein